MKQKYATFTERLLAYILDSLLGPIISVIWFFATTILTLILNLKGQENTLLTNGIIPIIQIIIPIMLLLNSQAIYSLFADSSKKHRTFGKGTQKIYVINKNGEYLNFKESFLRFIIKSISVLIPFGLLISIIMLLTSEKKQSLHDLILNQYVIKTEK